MSVIERAEQRLAEEERQSELGADNRYDLHYWAAYLDGARAQKKEGGELAMSALNYVERQGFMTGMGYAGMTAEERETLLKELRNLPVGPVAPLVVEHDYAKLIEALRCCAGVHTKPTKCPDYGDSWCGGECLDKHLIIAADAIEALQAEIRESMQRCAECGDELAHQMPKRGKWVGVNPMVDTVQCSVCGWNLYSDELKTPYCPNCGAKMEVQE